MAYAGGDSITLTEAVTWPVGAVIVKDGAVLSRGWTQPNGQAHAEIHAINQKSLTNCANFHKY